MLKSAFLMLLAFSVAAMPTIADASGGSSTGGGGSGGGGGGGGGKTLTVRVTGYITAIDYVNKTMVVGLSYYGTGVVKADPSTKVQINNVNDSFDNVQINDWAEVNYDYYTRIATKVVVTR